MPHLRGTILSVRHLEEFHLPIWIRMQGEEVPLLAITMVKGLILPLFKRESQSQSLGGLTTELRWNDLRTRGV